jgi:hypothetical protein
MRSASATPRKSTPQSSERESAWLKATRAASRSRRPIACATTVVVPTESIWVSASTMNIRLPAMPTAATAAVPSRPTQYRSTST